MYNPQAGNDDLEFVELSNITDAPDQSDGLEVHRRVSTSRLAQTTLPARSTLLVLRFDPNNPANAAKLAAFRAAYPSIPQGTILVGGYAGALNGGVLDNGGETVRLSRPDEPPPTSRRSFPTCWWMKSITTTWRLGRRRPDGTGPSLSAHEHTGLWQRSRRTGRASRPRRAWPSVTPGLTTITGTSGNDVYHVVRSGSQLHRL